MDNIFQWKGLRKMNSSIVLCLGIQLLALTMIICYYVPLSIPNHARTISFRNLSIWTIRILCAATYEARVLLKWCRTHTGYLSGIGTLWVLLHEYPRSIQKKKMLNISSNKHETASIFLLVLPSIKPLEHLSFILFWFQC